MVYSKPNTSTGAMKRSASALHEGAPGWDVAPPMMTPSRSSFRLPYAHYALIYLDNDGKLKVDESASIQEQNSTVFTPEVRQNFLEILGERIGFHQPIRRTLDASPRRVRRRRGNAPGSGIVDDRLADAGSDSDDFSPNGSNEMVPLRIGDTSKVMSYYEGALKHFQQLNCRMVAKAFIKFIEPRKQVRHPYNGGKPPPGSAPGTTGDPEKTKPEWWPPGVMHKEPDHLRKEYRIELLLHIIRKLGGHGITADKLKEVAGDTKRSLKHASHVEIIYEILRVRKMEERFERGEVDSNMVVYVMNRGPSPKGDEDEESNEGTVTAIEGPESIEDGLLTPTSSIAQNASLTTPIDTMPSMLSTPVTAEMISPHDVSVFDYSNSHPFPSSTPDQKYDTWAPTFRQNIFSPVDYNTPATTHGLPPPAMQYHMPMASPAQLHDMTPMDSMGQRALPFRTGSLGHPHEMPLPHPA
ncbi:uncharacterized protein N7482_002620 [Penicillium canariense]|uniref:Subtelomeric hrmA-associated cluster protein AFUB-079030/YDR124W-like helical bundle domain-containing protein n=1 Tax=Penicillium canariense TaxID=189055 RepID=A0A9W9IHC1_9EURO|nr:uncharacterized protein N7482_002620 [Penicillium canariense]KAJ5176743.1 hypothetical protein N7482_002620 [Penicillium canariense]